MKTNTFAVVWVLLSVAILAFVSSQDFDAEVQDHFEYCERVKDGIWPDYKNVYKSQCSEDFLKTLAKNFDRI